MMRRWWAVLALVAYGVVHASTVTVTWTNPTTNEDGSALTDLDHITIYWARCSTVRPPAAAGPFQSVTASPNSNGGFLVTTTLLAPLCFFLTASTTSGLTSPPSAMVVWTPLTAPGQPIQLN